MPEEIKILIAARCKEKALIFQEAVKLIPGKVIFHWFISGVKLMQYLLVTNPKNALVFFEADMRNKNGFECLAEIRANPKLKYLKLIMLIQEKDHKIKEAIEKGINYVIKQPGTIEDIKDMILYFLEKEAKPVPPHIKKFVFAHRQSRNQ